MKEKPFYEDESLFVSPTKDDTFALIKWVFVIALVAMVIGGLSWGMGWFNAPLSVTSAPNVQRLSREANDRYQALQAQQASIAMARQKEADFIALYGTDVTLYPQGKRDELAQIRTDLSNKITAYNQACGQYNSMWQDEWRDIPAPDDLPTRCEFIQ